MTTLHRTPSPSLRPFVKALWASDGTDPRPAATREISLPTGAMHVVFRVSPHPLRVFSSLDDATGRTFSREIVGGARATPYVRDISQPVRSVGVQLHPGMAPLLLGVPASKLAERHTPLEDLWGRQAIEMRERLEEAGSPERQLDLLESFLAARLPQLKGVHPAVAHALQRFETITCVRSAVEESGYSHRRFVGLFKEAVGLTPKLYCRVRRFQQVLKDLASEPRVAWVRRALDSGYSDQPHFNREFREFSGLSPGEYRALAPASPHHVPIRGRADPRGACAASPQ